MAAEFKIIASAETDQATADINKFAKTADKDLLSIAKSGNVAAAGIGKLNKAVGSSIPTLTNFGRVIQDAPFGIIGIANNIDPLISSFQSLKASTGSTGAALKSLFAGLAGPAGIAIGVSAVTSALVAFGPQIKEFFTSTKEINEETQKLNENIGEEKASIAGLIGVLQGSNFSLNDKKKAIAELRKEYPGYLKDLTDEELLSNNAAAAIQLTAKAILNRARARQLEENVGKNVIRQLELENTISSDLQTFRQAIKARNQLRNTTNSATLASESFAIRLQSSEKVVESLGASIKERVSEYKSLEAANNTTAASIANLTVKDLQNIKATNSQATSLKDVSSAAESASFSLDNLFQSIGTFTTGQEKALRLTNQETSALFALSKAADAAFLAKQKNLAIDKQRALGGSTAGDEGFDIAIKRGLDPAILELQAQAANDAADGMAKYAAATQNAALAGEVIGGVFNTAFQALVEGESPIQAITQSLKQLIVRLAAAAATAAVLSLILGGITGGAGAAGGFGAIFKGLLGLGGGVKLAAGGIASRPTPALIGDGGPEAVIPLSQLANIIGGVAMQMGGGSGGGLSIVRGQDIYYSNNNASRSFGRLFG